MSEQRDRDGRLVPARFAGATLVIESGVPAELTLAEYRRARHPRRARRHHRVRWWR